MGETKQARSKHTQFTDPLTNTNKLISLRTRDNISLKAKIAITYSLEYFLCILEFLKVQVLHKKKNQHNYRKQPLDKNILFCFLHTHWGGSSESLTTSKPKKKTSGLRADLGFHIQLPSSRALVPVCKLTIALLFTFPVRKAMLLFFTVHGLHNPNSHVHSAVSPNICFPGAFQIRELD